MRKSRETTAATREHIVSTSARLFREHGIQGTSVVDLMGAAGLTHGGFYKHFESKEALVAEACEAALAATHAQMSQRCKVAKDENALAALVTAYLSTTHCEKPSEGCLLAAMGPETVRLEGNAKAVVSEGIENLLSLVRNQLLRSGKEATECSAHGILASLVGGLMLARAMNDKNKSAAVLRDTREFVLSLS